MFSSSCNLSPAPLFSPWTSEPDKKYVKEYLDAPTNQKLLLEKKTAQQNASGATGLSTDGDLKAIWLSDNFMKDRVRLGDVKVNGEAVTGDTIVPTISEAVGGKVEVVQKVTNLIFQGITAEILDQMIVKLHNVGGPFMFPMTKDRRTTLEVSQKAFTLSQELILFYSEDPSGELPNEQKVHQDFYVKGKLLISGTSENLLASNVDKMVYKTYFTGTSPEKSGVEKALYGSWSFFRPELRTAFE